MIVQGENQLIPVEKKKFFREIFPFDVTPIIRFLQNIGNIWLADTTLRVRQQGWRNFSVEKSLKIYGLLNTLGGKKGIIRTSELLLYTKNDIEVLKKIKDLGFNFPKPIGLIRATKSDAE